MTKLFLLESLILILFVVSCNEEKNTSEKKISPFTIDSTKQLSIDEKEKAYRIDTLFSSLTKNNEFNGNVLIAEKGKIIYKKCFGIACQNQNLTDSSLFQLASVSKTITAALVLKLAEEKKINLEDGIKKYLPDFPYEGITIHQLLTHRSGLGNYIYFSGEFVTDKTKKLSNEDVYKIMIENKPALYLKPDAHFNYNNSNYMLLALICEKVTKTNFKKLVKENIFIPCGMKNSFFADEVHQNKNLTKGYTFSMKEVEGDMFDYVWGDKGIYTTTYDLFLFEEAYFSGKLIDTSSIEKAIQPMSKERNIVNYGYGWRMKEFKTNNKLIYHNGWWHGYRTALQRRLKDSICVIILSNRLNSSVYHTWRLFNAIDADTSKETEVEEN